MKRRNFFYGMIMMSLVTFFAACEKDDENMDNNNSPTVYMKNSVFSNANLVITEGTTVKWQNDDTMIHNVTADDGSFSSGDIQLGGSFSRTFTTTGTFAYQCTLHPGMVGVVVVNAK
jgi:plastocyanin